MVTFPPCVPPPLQDTVESMVRGAQDKCPHVLSDEKLLDDLRNQALAKAQVSMGWGKTEALSSTLLLKHCLKD